MEQPCWLGKGHILSDQATACPGRYKGQGSLVEEEQLFNTSFRTWEGKKNKQIDWL
jgi:hypothetical protein